jgi:HtrA serine peptidase 2
MCLIIYFLFILIAIKLWQVIEMMGDKVGVPMKVVVKRANDKLATLTVIPEESNLDL